MNKLQLLRDNLYNEICTEKNDDKHCALCGDLILTGYTDGLINICSMSELFTYLDILYGKDGTEWVYITSEIMRKIERYLNKHVDFLDKAEAYLITIEQMRLSLLDSINNTVTYLCTSLGYCNNIDIAKNDINAVLCNLMANFKTPVHPDDVFGYHIGKYSWHKQYSAPYYDLYLDTNKEFSVAGINEAIKAGDLSVLDDHDTLSYDSIIDLLRSPLYLRKYRNKYVEEEENADIYNRSEDNEDK